METLAFLHEEVLVKCQQYNIVILFYCWLIKVNKLINTDRPQKTWLVHSSDPVDTL